MRLFAAAGDTTSAMAAKPTRIPRVCNPFCGVPVKVTTLVPAKVPVATCSGSLKGSLKDSLKCSCNGFQGLELRVEVEGSSVGPTPFGETEKWGLCLGFW